MISIPVGYPVFFRLGDFLLHSIYRVMLKLYKRIFFHDPYGRSMQKPSVYLKIFADMISSSLNEDYIIDKIVRRQPSYNSNRMIYAEIHVERISILNRECDQWL